MGLFCEASWAGVRKANRKVETVLTISAVFANKSWAGARKANRKVETVLTISVVIANKSWAGARKANRKAETVLTPQRARIVKLEFRHSKSSATRIVKSEVIRSKPAPAFQRQVCSTCGAGWDL